MGAAGGASHPTQGHPRGGGTAEPQAAEAGKTDPGDAQACSEQGAGSSARQAAAQSPDQKSEPRGLCQLQSVVVGIPTLDQFTHH